MASAVQARVHQLNAEIIEEVANAIRRCDSIEDILVLFVNSESYRSLFYTWKDPETNLNLLQLAIVCQHAAMVRFLCHELHKSPKFNFEQTIHKLEENAPIHLACIVGNLEIVKYFVEVQQVDLTHGSAVTCPLPVSDFKGEAWHTDENTNPTRQKPLEICIKRKHLDCARYLCDVIINSVSRPSHVLEKSSDLHHACYLGIPEYVKLLLQEGASRKVNEKNLCRYTPLHVACIMGEDQCMELLLQNGADVNASAGKLTCLHVLYWTTFRAENMVRCTELFLRYGGDVNFTDHHNNSALDYLAWNLGENVHISYLLLGIHKAKVMLDYEFCRTDYNAPELPASEYHQQVLRCMELLLEAGGSTAVYGQNGIINHTILHTILQNTGRTLNRSLTENPMLVYKALELCFKYGADPNALAKYSGESAFAMLLNYGPPDVCHKYSRLYSYVHLFLLNGAHVDLSLYGSMNQDPVTIAIIRRYSIEVIKLLYNFMTLGSLFRSCQLITARNLWHHLGQHMQVKADVEENRQAWLQLILSEVRSLKHHSKLAILKFSHKSTVQLDELPLPPLLKSYLRSPEF